MLTYVIDIDRTLCDNSHRACLLKTICHTCKVSGTDEICSNCGIKLEYTKESFKEFLSPELMILDKPIKAAQRVLRSLLKNKQVKVVFLTGRREKEHKDLTINWLNLHFGDISQCEILMRTPFDLGMKPSDYKEKKFLQYRDTHAPSYYIFFDDDPYIWTMFSQYGLVLRCPDVWESLNPTGLPRNLEPTYNK